MRKESANLVNKAFEKIAEVYFGSNNTLHYSPGDGELSDLYDKVDGDSRNNIDEEANNYINSHPNKDKSFEDLEFNRKKNTAKHKHSGKVRSAGVVLGGVAPTIIGAGLGAAAGAIKPGSFQKSSPHFVFPPTSRGGAMKNGAKLFAKGSLQGQLVPQVAGASIGGLLGDRIGNKMDAKAKEKMGPKRYDNINLIESDLQKHMANPLIQKAILDRIKSENQEEKSASELVSNVFKTINK